MVNEQNFQIHHKGKASKELIEETRKYVVEVVINPTELWNIEVKLRDFKFDKFEELIFGMPVPSLSVQIKLQRSYVRLSFTGLLTKAAFR